MSKFRYDLPPRLLQAIYSALRAFDEHDLAPPTVMIVGEDIQRMILSAGVRPMDGSWGTIMGVEIRGVSDDIAAQLTDSRHPRFVFPPPHLNLFNNNNKKETDNDES